MTYFLNRQLKKFTTVVDLDQETLSEIFLIIQDTKDFFHHIYSEQGKINFNLTFIVKTFNGNRITLSYPFIARGIELPSRL